MKHFRQILPLSFFLLLLSATPLSAQSFISSGLVGSSADSTTAVTASDSAAYADGVRAIHERRWSDAIQIFSRIIDAQSASADASLYWKAYAFNKTGKPSDSIAACSLLRKDFATSRWVEECDALEIEMKVKGDLPAQPKGNQSGNLLLLSLNSMMHKNKTDALEQIDEILNSDAPESLKQEARFVLHSNSAETVNDQIVRIRNVEGDVRIHRADDKKAAPWEQAIDGLSIDSGDSIVTVDGRAEIEFEDASIAYLDANSILHFNTLSTVDGVPRTDMALLSGTASFHLRPTILNESYAIHTPTENLAARYPHPIDIRITSYSDAAAIKALNPETDSIALSSKDAPESANKNLYFSNGHYLKLTAPEDADRFDDWDNWVQQRYDARLKDMAEVERASGMNEPLPGLDQLAGKGEFFECVTHGMCWDPPQMSQTAPNSTSKLSPSLLNSDQRLSGLDYLNYFPCLYGYPMLMQMDFYDASMQYPPWSWAVCHTGGWVYSHRRHHYVWVAGRSRHHSAPVQWVRSGSTVAFIPKHPKDYASALPLNRSGAAFAIKGGKLGPIQIDPTAPISTIKHAPHGFENPPQPHLKSSPEPTLAMRTMHNSLTRASLHSASGAIPIKFDAKQGAFLAPSITHSSSGEAKTVFAPINNRNGTLQSSGSHTGFNSGSHGSSGGASGSHGSSGGSSAGSSGGSHSGSSSSASSSSSSSSSGGGGGHH